MDVFTVGIIVLLSITAIFYIVLFSFIFYWHLHKLTFIVAPAFFTFDFLIRGFIVVAVVSAIINYLPELIRFWGI